MKRIVICFDGTWSKPADEALPADRQVETVVRIARRRAAIHRAEWAGSRA